MKFIHTISKGSRFNQIYIPKVYEKMFDVGDLVEISLIEKKKIFYSNSANKLSSFKEEIIRKIFSFLSSYKEIKKVFIFGSFLTKNTDYKDIDILILIDNENEKFEKNVFHSLSNNINLNFHLISLHNDRFNESMKNNPLMRNIVYFSISNKEFVKLPDIEINEKIISYELMFPEDILDVEVSSAMIYNSLRRVILIENFLNKKDILPQEIDKIISNLIDKELYENIKKDIPISKNKEVEIKNIIRKKIKEFHKIIKNGKK